MMDTENMILYELVSVQLAIFTTNNSGTMPIVNKNEKPSIILLYLETCITTGKSSHYCHTSVFIKHYLFYGEMYFPIQVRQYNLNKDNGNL